MGIYFRHPASLLHDTGSHPENASRIAAVERRLEMAGWPGLEVEEAPMAERAWLERVHAPAHVDRIERLCAAGGGMIDADTVAVEASWAAALSASGAAATGAERLLAGTADWAFCGLRPPGHHAESDRAMGFCLFNHVAVGAAHAIAAAGARRVLILDWDVHHGNGTEEIFRSDPNVLYVSIHQSPLYPGTGAFTDVGAGAGEGATLNLPVPGGADGGLYRALLQHVVAPVAREFDPDLIIVSSGYDAHVDDPLAGCRVETADFGELTASLRDLGGEVEAPVLMVLEGGYDVDALADSVLLTVETLAASAPASPAPAAPVRAVVDALSGARWASAFSR